MKKNLILLLAFVVLIAVGMIYQWSSDQHAATTQKAENFLNKFDLARLARLEMKPLGAKQTLILARNDMNSAWQFTNASSTVPADQTKVQEFVSGLQQAGTSTVTLVSRQKSRQSEFGTDGKISTYFKLISADNKFLTINVGQPASSGLGTYVSLVGEDETWLLPGSWAMWLTKTDWQAGTSSPKKS